MMSFDSMLDQIAQVSPLAFVLVALAGLMMGIAPSSLPLMSVVAGYTVGAASEGVERRKTVPAQWRGGLILSLGFVLGMATVDAAVGGLFGLLGYSLLAVLAEYRAVTNFIIAAVLVVIGLALLRTIRIPLPVPRPELRPAASFGGAYALGIPFGLSTCPACTPMILPIMAAAAGTGSPWLGAVLLFTFGLARGAPLILIGVFAGLAGALSSAGWWLPRVERVGGVLLLLAAAWFLLQAAMLAGLVPPVGWLLAG